MFIKFYWKSAMLAFKIFCGCFFIIMAALTSCSHVALKATSILYLAFTEKFADTHAKQ